MGIIDHYDARELRVLWGGVNGEPVYMPYGTQAIIVTVPAPYSGTFEYCDCGCRNQPETRGGAYAESTVREP